MAARAPLAPAPTMAIVGAVKLVRTSSVVRASTAPHWRLEGSIVSTRAQDCDARAREIVAIGAAAGHRHGQGKRRTAHARARAGRERAVCRLESKTLNG